MRRRIDAIRFRKRLGDEAALGRVRQLGVEAEVFERVERLAPVPTGLDYLLDGFVCRERVFDRREAFERREDILIKENLARVVERYRVRNLLAVLNRQVYHLLRVSCV